MSELTAVQQAILACACRNSGRFSRSGLAKLLVGSGSSQTAGLAHDPDYGRLANHGRKAITFEIDILIQQGYLALDHNRYIVPGPNFPAD